MKKALRLLQEIDDMDVCLVDFPEINIYADYSGSVKIERIKTIDHIGFDNKKELIKKLKAEVKRLKKGIKTHIKTVNCDHEL